MSSNLTKEDDTPVTMVNSKSLNSVVVPLLDLTAQYRLIADDIKAAMEEVVASQQFILGPKVHALEEAIAEYCQCEHGVGVSSGSDALLVALMALDVGVGHEVITTPFTFIATGGAIARVGARPLFCDIDPVTYNLSPQSVQAFIDNQCELKDGKLINRSTGGWIKVLLPVHLYGQMADMEAFLAIASANHLRIVEDAAQAIGAECPGGRRAGSMSDIGCFSFFPSKNLGAFGDAGMCTTNDAALANRLRILRTHGGAPKYHHAVIGGNFRLDALQAVVLSVKLQHLDQWTAQRQAKAATYCQGFEDVARQGHITPPCRLTGCRHIYNQFVLRVQRRDELREVLTKMQIGSEVYYPIPLHLQKCFADLGLKKGDMPVSERVASETVAIPVYPELREDQQRHVIETIKSFYS